MMRRFQVAIIGGGPAGTSTALHLVKQQGICPSDVCILERNMHPRDKPCAGAISAWGLEVLDDLGMLLRVPYAPIRGLRVLFRGDATSHEEPRRLGVVVRRAEFDASLWAEVQRLDVVARDGEDVVDISRERDGFALRTNQGVVFARYLAVCDGAFGRTRKLLGIREAARKGHLYVTETEMTAQDEGVRRGWCDFDLTPCEDGVAGYYWDFPMPLGGEIGVNRGIYHANFEPGAEPKAALARALLARGLDVARVRLRPFSTRPFHRRSVVAIDGAWLVGEAAGIDWTTGEGIAQALWMGRVAARDVARAIRSKRANASRYKRSLFASRPMRHLLESAWLAPRVLSPGGDGYRKLLAQSSEAVRAGALWYQGAPIPWWLKAHVVGAFLRAHGA